MTEKSRQRKAEAVLVLVTLFWGTTFPIVKQTIQTIAVHRLLTLRFSIASAGLWILALSRPNLRAEAKRLLRQGTVLRAGAILGFVLFISYDFQTYGLITTTASKSAFITGSNVLWTPILTFFFLHKRHTLRTLLLVGAGWSGLLLLVMGSGLGEMMGGGPVLGDGLTVVCAVAIAAHLILTKRFSHLYPTTLLTAIQLSVVTLLSVAGVAVVEAGESWAYPIGAYASVLFLAIFPTAFAFWAQTRMQRYTTEERTAIVFLFEPVFGAVMAYFYLGEIMSVVQWLGAGVILASVVAMETNFFVRAGANET